MQLPGGGISYSLIGSKWVNGTWVTIEGVYTWMNFRISFEGNYIPFALNENFIR